MAITIDFTPAEEARIFETAKRIGKRPSELVRKLVADNLPAMPEPSQDDPMLSLFAHWDCEDANMTAEESAGEDAQWEQFQASINAERDRAGARRVF